MKDYSIIKEELMDAMVMDLEEAYDHGYDQGYEDGKKASCDCKDNMEAEYNRGLNNAWEAAKKIQDAQIPYEVFGLDKTGNGFAYASPLNWGETITAQEAISKIKEYEEQQEQDTIQVGDEVDYHGDKYIVTLIANSGSTYTAISADGSHILRANRDNITFTGRHFDQIAEVLAEMRGEK